MTVTKNETTTTLRNAECPVSPWPGQPQPLPASPERTALLDALRELVAA